RRGGERGAVDAAAVVAGCRHGAGIAPPRWHDLDPRRRRRGAGGACRGGRRHRRRGIVAAWPPRRPRLEAAACHPPAGDRLGRRLRAGRPAPRAALLLRIDPAFRSARWSWRRPRRRMGRRAVVARAADAPAPLRPFGVTARARPARRGAAGGGALPRRRAAAVEVGARRHLRLGGGLAVATLEVAAPPVLAQRRAALRGAVPG